MELFEVTSPEGEAIARLSLDAALAYAAELEQAGGRRWQVFDHDGNTLLQEAKEHQHTNEGQAKL